MAKWLHVGRYATGGKPEVAIQQSVQPLPKPGPRGGCEDMDNLCPEWAASGEWVPAEWRPAPPGWPAGCYQHLLRLPLLGSATIVGNLCLLSLPMAFCSPISCRCVRNINFMVGSRGRPGKCVQSCNRCDVVTTTGAEARQLLGSMRGDLR
jgi:prolyl 4-hydroxylase